MQEQEFRDLCKKHDIYLNSNATFSVKCQMAQLENLIEDIRNSARSGSYAENYGHSIEADKIYKRRDDMSTMDFMSLMLQPDGDVVVTLFTDKKGFNQIEFCSLTNGGGRSKHTREALINLMVAIDKDNAERPID